MAVHPSRASQLAFTLKAAGLSAERGVRDALRPLPRGAPPRAPGRRRYGARAGTAGRGGALDLAALVERLGR
ncbi:MAG: hypothetical protein M5U28_18055 [Sandaracinaceae bacterium]|nr:hypothetical protein [Sandaracinaceae bacterium]